MVQRIQTFPIHQRLVGAQRKQALNHRGVAMYDCEYQGRFAGAVYRVDGRALLQQAFNLCKASHARCVMQRGGEICSACDSGAFCPGGWRGHGIAFFHYRGRASHRCGRSHGPPCRRWGWRGVGGLSHGSVVGNGGRCLQGFWGGRSCRGSLGSCPLIARQACLGSGRFLWRRLRCHSRLWRGGRRLGRTHSLIGGCPWGRPCR